VNVRDGNVILGEKTLGIEPNGAVSGPSQLFIRRHDLSVQAPGSTALEGAIKRVRAFGPNQRAEIALNASGQETLIEIDAPRDRELKVGEVVGLEPRRYRIFANPA
jgi:sulfate transport system ATP-binding protein